MLASHPAQGAVQVPRPWITTPRPARSLPRRTSLPVDSAVSAPQPPSKAMAAPRQPTLAARDESIAAAGMPEVGGAAESASPKLAVASPGTTLAAAEAASEGGSVLGCGSPRQGCGLALVQFVAPSAGDSYHRAAGCRFGPASPLEAASGSPWQSPGAPTVAGADTPIVASPLATTPLPDDASPSPSLSPAVGAATPVVTPATLPPGSLTDPTSAMLASAPAALFQMRPSPGAAGAPGSGALPDQMVAQRGLSQELTRQHTAEAAAAAEEAHQRQLARDAEFVRCVSITSNADRLC